MEHTAQAGFPALLVVVFSIIIFHGSIYLLVGLNMGWRFGYWVSGAAMGGFMVFISLFWLTNALGPRGEEPRYFPIEASSAGVVEATLGKQAFESPAAYPDAPWEKEPPAPKPTLLQKFNVLWGEVEIAKSPETDAFAASATNCVSFDDAKIESTEHEIERLTGFTRLFLEGKFGKKSRTERELETCTAATSLVPTDVPKVDGQPVSVIYDVEDVRFTTEAGTTLAQGVVVPNTYDRRVTGDPEGRKPLQVGEPITILAYKDQGSLRYPSWLYTIGSLLYFAFHMWGLSRAERRKLSPILA